MANDARRIGIVHMAAVLVAKAVYLPNSAVFIVAGPAKLVVEGRVRRVISRGVNSC